MTRRTPWFCFAHLLALALFAPAGLMSLAAEPAHAGQHCVTCVGPEATYLCEAQNGPGILAANGGQLACITGLAKRGGHDSCSVIRRAAAKCDGLVPTVLYPGADQSDTIDDGADASSPRQPKPQDIPDTTTNASPTLPASSTVEPVTEDGTGTSASENFTADDSDPLNPAEEQEAAAAPKGPPKTVAEMAGRAYDDSKKGLGNAGKAVGDSAKSAGKVVTKTAKKTGEQIGKAGKAVGNAASKTWTCLTSLFSDC